MDHVVTAWCVDNQRRLAVMHGHCARVTGVNYLAQHGQFATCSFDKTVKLWDADRFTSVGEVRQKPRRSRGRALAHARVYGSCHKNVGRGDRVELVHVDRKVICRPTPFSYSYTQNMPTQLDRQTLHDTSDVCLSSRLTNQSARQAGRGGREGGEDGYE